MNLNESRIDFPVSDGLCPDLWDKTSDGKWKVRPSIRRRLLDEVDRIGRRMHVKVTSVRIIGSICTNLYGDTTDIDVHLGIDRKFADDDAAYAFNNRLWSFYDDNEVKVKKHPVQFFIQHNFFRDLASVGVYALDRERWVRGPQIYPATYNPFDELKGAMPVVNRLVDRFSKDWGRLESAVRNYIVCRQAEDSKYSRKSVVARSKHELSDAIKKACKDIISLKEEVQAARRSASSDINSFKDAKKFRDSKAWHNADAVAKYMDRYGYLSKCSSVKEIVGDGLRVSDSTVYDLAELLGIA